MSDVVSVESLGCDGNGLCTAVACIDNAVVVVPASYEEPEEYGPALCRGTFYIQDDEVIPGDELELCDFVGQRVDYWQVVDTSDY
jgi:hypothetical protein